MKELSDEEILFPEVEVRNIRVIPWTFNKLFKINVNLHKLSKKIEYLNTLNTDVKYTQILRLLSFLDINILKILEETLNLSEEQIYNLDLYDGLRLVVTIYYQNKSIINNKKIESKKVSKITLADIFGTLITNNIGNSIDDLKTNYTIDQVYMFYEKCIKNELENQRKNAITLAHALVYASPSYDKNSGRKKQNMWDNYIDSLELKKKKVPTAEGIINVFRAIGIPISYKEVKKNGS